MRATSSAPMSGTWPMICPVAGFSTGICPSAPPPLWAARSGLSSVAMALRVPLPGSTDVTSVRQRYALDYRVLDRLVVLVGLARLDLVDHVHSFDHAAEDGVLAVEPGSGIGGDDEELAAVGV